MWREEWNDSLGLLRLCLPHHDTLAICPHAIRIYMSSVSIHIIGDFVHSSSIIGVITPTQTPVLQAVEPETMHYTLSHTVTSRLYQIVNNAHVRPRTPERRAITRGIFKDIAAVASLWSEARVVNDRQWTERPPINH